MAEFALRPRQDQETGGVARRKRVLGDGTGREIEVEVGGLQKRFDWPGSRSMGLRPKC